MTSRIKPLAAFFTLWAALLAVGAVPAWLTMRTAPAQLPVPGSRGPSPRRTTPASRMAPRRTAVPSRRLPPGPPRRRPRHVPVPAPAPMPGGTAPPPSPARTHPRSTPARTVPGTHAPAPPTRQPASAPSPTPSPPGSSTCITLLLKVCVPATPLPVPLPKPPLGLELTGGGTQHHPQRPAGGRTHPAGNPHLPDALPAAPGTPRRPALQGFRRVPAPYPAHRAMRDRRPPRRLLRMPGGTGTPPRPHRVRVAERGGPSVAGERLPRGVQPGRGGGVGRVSREPDVAVRVPPPRPRRRACRLRQRLRS